MRFATLHGLFIFTIRPEFNKLENSHGKKLEDAKKQINVAANSLEHAKRKLDYIESAVQAIVESLCKDLQAVDNTLGLHEILINPDIIPPIRTQDAERYSDHGAMTRAIFERLKLPSGQSVSTFEFTHCA